MQSIELKMEKQDFRTKEAFKTLRTNIEFSGENIRVVTRGIGHGFGLSQHMAAVLSEEGKDYREILAYFFPEAELTQEKMK